ncbi:MAG TPA: DUF6059 family protein [Streptosporangiaceae bacterium]|nr:DUF6059 family protein [Streptosporangiaceae bacterium]
MSGQEDNMTRWSLRAAWWVTLSRLRRGLWALAKHVAYGLALNSGGSWVSEQCEPEPVTAYAAGTGPPSGHPEQITRSVPTDTECAIWRDIGEALRMSGRSEFPERRKL